MKKTLNFLLMLVIVASVFSCKKKDPELTPAQKIVGKWRITASTVSENGAAPVNTLEACNSDDVIEFTSTQVITTAGTTKCYPSEPSTQTDTYTISSDGKILTITPSSFPIPFPVNVIELSSSTLKISSTSTDTFNGVTTTSIGTSTFTKI